MQLSPRLPTAPDANDGIDGNETTVATDATVATVVEGRVYRRYRRFRRYRRSFRRSSVVTVATVAAVAATPTVLSAQSLTGTPLAPSTYPDARLVPRGVLRIGFEPEYITYEELYDANGDFVALGAPFSSDSAGTDLFPTAEPMESAVRSIADASTHRLSIGRLTTTRDADIRRFPFNLEFGLSSRLSFIASIPIVTTRAQVSVSLDTTDANAGLNPAADGQAIAQLIDSFEAQAGVVQGRIDAGDYGCPTSPGCESARATVAVAQALAADLRTGFVGSPVAPFAPLMSSAIGQAVAQRVAEVAADLTRFGAAPSASQLPLPTTRLDSTAVQRVLTDPVFGYGIELDFVKYRQKLGDLELGLRWGVVQLPSLRAVVFGTARLPTGMRDDPNHLIDLGTGDRQTDVIGGLEAVWAPGDVVALALTGAYTLQFADNLTRRVPAAGSAFPTAEPVEVSRNLGEVLRLSGYPSLRLSDAFTAYGSVHYFSKTADVFDAAELGNDTAWRSLSFGAGVHYSPQGTRGGLPIQAGIDYRAAFRGKNAPKDVRLNFYLRLYYRVFGDSS